jgi:hypothetical protein
MRRERPADPPADEMRGLIQLARRELLRNACGEQDEVKRDLLISAQRRALDRRRRNFWVASLVAAAALGLIFYRARLASEPLLAYNIREHALDAGVGRVFVASYVFSDGSSISLDRDAALTIESADRTRPSVRLERGQAKVKVVHRAEAHWTFLAGPFEVAVIGTAFDLQWSPSARDFSLNLREGVVQITGPVLDGPLLLRAGHRVSVSVASGRVAITSAAEPAGSDNALLPTPAAPSSPMAMPTSSTLSSSLPTPSSRAAISTSASSATSKEPPLATSSLVPGAASFRTLVNRGAFETVIREAQGLPLDGCFARCSAADLRSLGDAARYTGQASLAERAFLALRSRFPGTADGAVAAFLLARTYETQRRPEQAAAWYAHYLSEAPNGQFAVEAKSGLARVGALH